jgi:hypothetical protein
MAVRKEDVIVGLLADFFVATPEDALEYEAFFRTEIRYRQTDFN